MRAGVFVISAALLLAFAAWQNVFPPSTGAQAPASAITACAQVGAAVQGEGCEAFSPDSTPGSVISHTVLAQGCLEQDLHVVRYVPAGDPRSAPLTATWCG